MELFKIGDGPWERMYEGNSQGSEIEIYSNPEGMLLVLIYDKEKNKVVGAVVEIFKVFYSQGDAEHFVETLPRKMILINKHEGEKQDNKFLLLASEPSYVQWNEKAMLDETEKLLKKLRASSTLIKDISKAYDINLTELGNSPEKVRGIFFAEPLVIPLATESARKEAIAVSGGEILPKSITKGELVLGMTKEKQKITEPLALFSRTLITDGVAKERKRIMQVMVESALMSNVSAVIFDRENSFDGIGQPTDKRDELKKYELEQEPIGFPAKKFQIGPDVKIELAFTSPEGFCQLFGMGDNIISKTVIAAMQKGQLQNMNELIEKIKIIPPGDEPNAFEIGKIVRVLTLLNNMYPGIFNKNSSVEAMVKGSTKALGKANIVDLSKSDDRIALLAMHNVLSKIRSYFREQRTGGMGILVVIPQAAYYLGDSQKVIEKDMAAIIREFEQLNVGFVISEEKEIDSPKDLLPAIETKINVVKGNDVGVQLKGKKSYRVLVRPTLSRE